MKTVSKIKKAFLDSISFNTPEARVFNISTVLAALAIVPTGSLVYSPFKCVFKHLLFPLIFGRVCPTEGLFAGCNCPACGMTRALSRLLHGDLKGSFAFNKMAVILLIAMVTMLIIDTVRIVKKNKKQIN